MATASATIAIPSAAVVGPAARRRTGARVHHIRGLNSFGGLKAHNKVASLGSPISVEESFSKIVSSLKKPSKRGSSTLASTCSAVEEIFRIAAIMPALVLVGVAVGFVLLRIEAFVEEEA